MTSPEWVLDVHLDVMHPEDDQYPSRQVRLGNPTFVTHFNPPSAPLLQPARDNTYFLHEQIATHHASLKTLVNDRRSEQYALYLEHTGESSKTWVAVQRQGEDRQPRWYVGGEPHMVRLDTPGRLRCFNGAIIHLGHENSTANGEWPEPFKLKVRYKWCRSRPRGGDGEVLFQSETVKPRATRRKKVTAGTVGSS